MSLDPSELEQHIDEVARLAAHPAMLEALAEIQAAEPADRLEVARRVADRDALAKRGLDVPPDFRIALREFEDPIETGSVTEQVISEPAAAAPHPRPHPHPHPPKNGGGTTICGSVGYFVCASIGHKV